MLLVASSSSANLSDVLRASNILVNVTKRAGLATSPQRIVMHENSQLIRAQEKALGLTCAREDINAIVIAIMSQSIRFAM
jgi:hypothetical protein